MSQTGSFITALKWETSDAETPARSEYQINWNAVDGHVHDNRGTGQGIRTIQTTNAPTQTGDIQITGDTLRWWGSASNNVISVAKAYGFQNYTTAQSTTSGANVAIASDCKVTVMTTGGDLMVWIMACLTSTNTAAKANVSYSVDGVASLIFGDTSFSSTTLPVNSGLVGVATALAAGVHTIQPTWATNAGTLALGSAGLKILVMER